MAAATAAYYVAAVAAGASIQQNRQASKQQKKASKAQARLAEFKANRQRQQQVRQQRILSAELENQAVASGTADSSGFAGGISSISSQTYGNIFSINTQTAYGSKISSFTQKAANNRSRASSYGTASQAFTIFAQGYNPGSGDTQNTAAGATGMFN